MAPGGASGEARIASSARRAPAIRADSSAPVAVTVKTLSRARSTLTPRLCRTSAVGRPCVRSDVRAQPRTGRGRDDPPIPPRRTGPSAAYPSHLAASRAEHTRLLVRAYARRRRRASARGNPAADRDRSRKRGTRARRASRSARASPGTRAADQDPCRRPTLTERLDLTRVRSGPYRGEERPGEQRRSILLQAATGSGLALDLQLARVHRHAAAGRL